MKNPINNEINNVISFFDVAYKQYYGPNLRELSEKKQIHLECIVSQYKKNAVVKKKDQEDGSSIA